eukprot:gene12969-13098_t
MQRDHFHAALQQLHAGQPGEVSAYVCGPPQMTDQVVRTLAALGLPQRCLHAEKWW